MGYTYQCDSCGDGFNEPPPFGGEFRESYLQGHGGHFANAGYHHEQTVTFCPNCLERVLL